MALGERFTTNHGERILGDQLLVGERAAARGVDICYLSARVDEPHIQGGKIAEVWLQFSDQQAIDEFASS